MSSSQYTRGVETMLLSSRRITRWNPKKIVEESKNATWDDEPSTTTTLQDANRLQQIQFSSKYPGVASSLLKAASVGASLSYTTSNSTQHAAEIKKKEATQKEQTPLLTGTI
jgi:hypothetical protein